MGEMLEYALEDTEIAEDYDYSDDSADEYFGNDTAESYFSDESIDSYFGNDTAEEYFYDDSESGYSNDTSDSNYSDDTEAADRKETRYYFRNSKLLKQHYEKHGIEMGFDSEEAYEKAASDVINNPDALHKVEAEDGDDVYYVEDTNEFVVLSTDGYIRTYFNPNGGKAYFDRQ
ncbi:MAG: hypothetical protein K5669_04090 [Lachnospiraceae bacterium]|nr:hypothetical protein [Lachnospiraceae bacterium]